MSYELVTNLGYAGTVVFAIFTIYLCVQLNIKKCILEVTGLERKKRIKVRRKDEITKGKKKRDKF